MRNPFVAAVALVLLAACKPDAPQPTPAPSATAPASASASSPASATASAPSAPPSASAAANSGKSLHCPSAVDGTNTAVADVPGGVQLTVTARDPSDDAAVKEIRARAAFLVDAAKAPAAGTVHNGSGDVAGKFGRCTVVMRGTTVAATDVAGGSSIVVVAKDVKEQDWLRAETRSRVDELSDPAADANMHVKEVHCPTSVVGAKTAVTDAPDGVSVAVTSADPSAAKEIRDRTHTLVDAMQIGRAGGGKGDQNGKGGGHGGFGKCPLVVRGTTVDSADSPTGVTVRVHAKDPTQADAVRKQVRDRVATPATP